MKNGKLDIWYKIFIVFLALILANGNARSAISESKYNNNTVKLKAVKSVKNIDLDAYFDYFAEPDYSGDYDEKPTHVHAYVDDNKCFIKWLPCEKLTVDGLHWTQEKKYLTDDEIIESFSHDEWGIVEPHANLYYNWIHKCVVPIYQEDVPKDDSWVKCFGIRFLSRDKCKILMETGLQRVVDNIDLISIANRLSQFGSDRFKNQYDVENLLFLRPVLIDSNKMICQSVLVTEGTINYDRIKDMLLYRSTLMVWNENVATYETKVKYVQVSRVKSFQKSLVIPPVKMAGY